MCIRERKREREREDASLMSHIQLICFFATTLQIPGERERRIWADQQCTCDCRKCFALLGQYFSHFNENEIHQHKNIKCKHKHEQIVHFQANVQTDFQSDLTV